MGKKWLVVAVLGALSSVAQAQMTWEVVNRFPLLKQEAFLATAAAVGSEAADLHLRLTQVDFRNTVKHLDGLTLWDERANRYDASRLLSNKAEVSANANLGPTECSWTLVKNGGDVAYAGKGVCDKSPDIPVVLGEVYELRAVRAEDGQSVTSAVKPRRHLVVAVGDSFTSGEGNPDYAATFRKYTNPPPYDWAVDPRYPVSKKVTSARWLDTRCHRSLLSWPALYALGKALTQRDTVVQFASFACSGAEVVDGFLLPQNNPPGDIGVKLERPKTRLRLSQQQALAEFLCLPAESIKKLPVVLDDVVHGYVDSYFGRPATTKEKNVQVARCTNLAKPDEVFVGFGGNDTGFGGAVMHVFQPQPLEYGFFIPGLIVGSVVNFGIYKSLAPLDPAAAVELVDNKLPALYKLLQTGMTALQLDPASTTVRLLQYPDPTGDPDAKAERESCQGRTRDANMPLQRLVGQKARHGSAFFGAAPGRLKTVGATYVKALRDQQEAAARTHKWQVVDSHKALDGRSLCGGSLECDKLGKDCPLADRVRWNFRVLEGVITTTDQTWSQFSDFVPYDDSRKRGMRYANDALLTSARLSSDKKRVRLDWLAGLAHPTAAVHARIAAQVAATTPVELAKKNANP